MVTGTASMVTTPRTLVFSVDRSKSEACGFSIRGGAEFGLGVFISSVSEGSIADTAGFQLGDQILNINGNNFENITHGDAVEVIKSTSVYNVVVVSTGRIPDEDQPPGSHCWVTNTGEKVIEEYEVPSEEEGEGEGVDELPADNEVNKVNCEPPRPAVRFSDDATNETIAIVNKAFEPDTADTLAEIQVPAAVANDPVAVNTTNEITASPESNEPLNEEATLKEMLIEKEDAKKERRLSGSISSKNSEGSFIDKVTNKFGSLKKNGGLAKVIGAMKTKESTKKPDVILCARENIIQVVFEALKSTFSHEDFEVIQKAIKRYHSGESVEAFLNHILKYFAPSNFKLLREIRKVVYADEVLIYDSLITSYLDRKKREFYQGDKKKETVRAKSPWAEDLDRHPRYDSIQCGSKSSCSLDSELGSECEEISSHKPNTVTSTVTTETQTDVTLDPHNDTTSEILLMTQKGDAQIEIKETEADNNTDIVVETIATNNQADDVTIDMEWYYETHHKNLDVVDPISCVEEPVEIKEVVLEIESDTGLLESEPSTEPLHPVYDTGLLEAEPSTEPLHPVYDTVLLEAEPTTEPLHPVYEAKLESIVIVEVEKDSSEPPVQTWNVEELGYEKKSLILTDSQAHILVKSQKLIGFSISGGSESALQPEIRVASVTPGTAGHEAGLKVGQVILFIDDHSLVDVTHKEACRIIRRAFRDKTTPSMEIVVGDEES